MTIRSLEIFLTVAETGSMSAAARELVISQSSVSQVILDIEKEYGILLFERFNHALKLTPVGNEILKYAKDILLLNNELTSVLNHESRVSRIRLGATMTVGATVMKPAVRGLEKEFPDLKCTVHVTNTRGVEKMILSNDLDIGLVEGKIDNPCLIQKVAMNDVMVLICGREHRLAGVDEVRIRDLIGEPWIMREPGSGTRAQVMKELEAHSVVPEIAWCCNGIECIKDGVAKGFGISVLSERLVRNEIERGELWSCRIADADFRRTFKLVYHKDKFITRTMKRFMDLCCLQT